MRFIFVSRLLVLPYPTTLFLFLDTEQMFPRGWDCASIHARACEYAIAFDCECVYLLLIAGLCKDCKNSGSVHGGIIAYANVCAPQNRGGYFYPADDSSLILFWSIPIF